MYITTIRAIFCSAIILCAKLTYAQEFNAVKNVVPPSPSVRDMQKYGDIPVSFYSGLPQISIPIYTIRSNDLEIPITINYHGSGIKVTDASSWVGTGWSLSAGGTISRSVNGLPDFCNYVKGGDFGGVHPYYFDTEIPSPAPDNSDQMLIEHVLENKTDTQPDVYYFNFLGRSGKFLISQDYEILIDPREKLKIASPPTQTSPYWIIYDDNGTKFTFGGTDFNELTNSLNPDASNGRPVFVSAWHLKEIESQSGTKITFAYKVPKSVGVTSASIVEYDYGNNPCLGNGGPSNGKEIESGFSTSESQVRYIDYIDFKTGNKNFRVEFTSITTGITTREKLKTIAVRDLDAGVIRKSTQLNFDDFVNKLWLKSVDEKFYNPQGIETTQNPGFKFEYYRQSDFPVNFNYTNYAVDYWGYYNGVTSNSSLLPLKGFQGGYIQTYTTGGNRDPDVEFAKIGALTKIIYPTGGYTEFEYELHQFSNWMMTQGSSNSAGGGLRVKKIIDAPSQSAGNKKVKRYFYFDPLTPQVSSGKIMSPFKNFEFMDRYVFCNGYVVKSRPKVRTSYSLTNGPSSVIGYSCVIEQIGESGEGGRNLYYYVNNPIIEPGVKGGYQNEKLYFPISDQFSLNGSLLKKVIEKKNQDGTYSPIQEVKNYYSTKSSTSVPGLLINGLSSLTQDGGIGAGLCRVNKCSLYPFTEIVSYLGYTLSDSWISLDSTITFDYYNSGPFKNKTIYNRNFNSSNRIYKDCILSEYSLSSNGKYKKTYNYPFQQLSNPVFSEMRNRNMINPVSTATYKVSDVPFEPYEYFYFLNGVKIDFNFYASNSSFGNSIHPQNSYSIFSTDGSNTTEEIDFTVINYSTYGKPNEVVSKDGIRTSYLWKEDDLLAFCLNAASNEFFYEGFEYESTATLLQSHTGLKSSAIDYQLLFVLPNSKLYVLSFWYHDGNSWIYNEQPYTGPTTITLGNYLDDIRIYPKGSQLTTYTYDASFGMTSVSDPNSIAQYFEYDDARRLRIIRDSQKNILNRIKYAYKINN